ncbi:toxin-antitoxin system YwqK family antitoxin [Bacillus rhizoplanae]|uniref:toxin-antitoxin system YwqK family antitoxin n=1 Tax=Bacillus rhizoplanae TaxID=2880966 RepID=UPI003D1AAA84
MENQIDILNKEYVIEHGTDFDEDLWFASYSDEVLDNPEDENGKPFTGLAYELYDNGNLMYYTNYVKGFIEGELIEFYENGNLKSVKKLIHGQSNGTERIWYESGELKFEGEYKFGIALHYMEWDEKGRIIKQKISPTETDLKLIESFSKSDTQ